LADATALPIRTIDLTKSYRSGASDLVIFQNLISKFRRANGLPSQGSRAPASPLFCTFWAASTVQIMDGFYSVTRTLHIWERPTSPSSATGELVSFGRLTISCPSSLPLKTS
jgi:hypothetical protein